MNYSTVTPIAPDTVSNTESPINNHFRRNSEYVELILTLAVILVLYWLFPDFKNLPNGAFDRYAQREVPQIEFTSFAKKNDFFAVLCSESKILPPHVELKIILEICREKLSENPNILGELDETYTNIQNDFAKVFKDSRNQISQPEETGEPTEYQLLVKQLIESFELNNYSGESIRLKCAWQAIRNEVMRSNQSHRDQYAMFLGLAALLDGKDLFPFKELLELKSNDIFDDKNCQRLGTPAEVAEKAAQMMATARTPESQSDRYIKNKGMKRLLEKAHLQFSAWAALGWLLLVLGRRASIPAILFPLSIALWGILGWVSEIPAPEWTPNNLIIAGFKISAQDLFPISLIIFGVVIWIILRLLSLHGLLTLTGQNREFPSSCLAYPGFVLFIGIGWWLLLDQSATAYPKNQYLAYYHCLTIFSVFIRDVPK